MPEIYHPSQDCYVLLNTGKGDLGDCYPWRKGDTFYGKSKPNERIEVIDCNPPHKSLGSIRAPGAYNSHCTYATETDADIFIKGNYGISHDPTKHVEQQQLQTFVRRTKRNGHDGYPWMADDIFVGVPSDLSGNIKVYTLFKPHSYLGLTSYNTCRDTYEDEDQLFRETYGLLEDEFPSPFTFPIY